MAVLSRSAEDYLEAILVGEQEDKVVRVSALAERMRVRMPSVVAALKGLEAKGLVRHERYGHAELTPQGRTEASKVYERHRVLYHFLTEFLGLDRDTAELDACSMEHALSERTVQHFLRFVRYVQGVPAGETACIAGFRDYLKDGTRRQCVAKSGPELRGEGAVDG